MSDPKSATQNQAQPQAINTLTPQSAHAAVAALVGLYDGIGFEYERSLHGTRTQLARTQEMLTDALDKNKLLVMRCEELEQRLAAANSPVVKIEKAEEQPEIDPLS